MGQKLESMERVFSDRSISKLIRKAIMISRMRQTFPNSRKHTIWNKAWKRNQESNWSAASLRKFDKTRDDEHERRKAMILGLKIRDFISGTDTDVIRGA